MYKRQDISDTSFLFREMLKMKRRELPPHIRARTQSPQIRTLRLYPFATEREYRQYVIDLLSIYSHIALPIVRNNIERWTEEQKADSRADDFNTEFQQLINDMNQTQKDMFDEGGTGVQDEKGNFYNYVAIGAVLSAIGHKVSRFNQKQEDKITKRILGQPFVPAEPWLDNVVQTWANNNFGLIKSLSNEYIKKLNFIVSEGVGDGRTWNAIMKDVRGMDRNITKTRARLLTRDQIGKLNGRLTKRRSQEAGISVYRWLTAADERVRSRHKKLHNKLCKWEADHLYADSEADVLTGNWKSRSGAGMYVGVPGQDIQCRCSSAPVFVSCGSTGVDSMDRKDVGPVCKSIIGEVDKELAKEEAIAKGEKPPIVPKPKKEPAPKPVRKPKPENVFDKEFGKNSLGKIDIAGEENLNQIYKRNKKNFENVKMKYKDHLKNSIGEGAVKFEEDMLDAWGASANTPAGSVMKLWGEERRGAKTYYHKRWVDNIKDRRKSFVKDATLVRKSIEKDYSGMIGKTNVVFDSQYKFSQHILKQVSPTGKVKLYRGVKRDYILNQGLKPVAVSEGKVMVNSLSSWTTSKVKAKSFAETGGFILESEIPIERIVTSNLSSKLVSGEGEFIVSGGPLKSTIKEVIK